MGNIEYRQKMLGMVKDMLLKKQSVRDFEKEFYFFFLDDVPSDALEEDDEEFFIEIKDKLEMLSESPTEEDRKYGYIKEDEFFQWIVKYVKNSKYRDILLQT